LELSVYIVGKANQHDSAFLIQEEKIKEREIIQKLYFLVWCIARQRATHATPHLSESRYRTFYTWWSAKCELHVRDLLAGITRAGGGGGGAIRRTVPFVNGSLDQLQTQMSY
jgi:hypothetical protein